MSTPKGNNEFNIYDDIKKKLIARGIPEKEIAFIHSAGNEQQKDEDVYKRQIESLFK